MEEAKMHDATNRGEAVQADANEAPSVERERHEHRLMWALLGAFVVLAALVMGAWMLARAGIPANVGDPLEGEAKAEAIANNSPLTDYVHLTQNADFPRTDNIKKITIHHMAGDLTLEDVGDKFARRDSQVSSNYAIDSEGRVALYVEEANRAWTSNNRANDEEAVTIEVANDELYDDWHVSDAAFDKLVELCADICKRNGIERLEFSEDGSGNLNYHQMLDSSTECPGPYLIGKMGELASRVNEVLANG